MRYTDILTGLASLLVLASCGNSSGGNDGIVMDTSIQQPSATTLPAPANDQVSVETVTAPAAIPASVTATGLNPAHGQPGHRCDIAVGAPLNSQPTVTTTPATIAPASPPATITASQPAVVTTAPATPTNTATGLNPAHGQPGHRCDIAVGAPLNSKPAAGTSTPLPLTPSIPAATPISSTPAKTTTVATAPGMNPPHGQPGHRCDISVGAPLNSKPAETVKAKETAVNIPDPNDANLTPAEKEKKELERIKAAEKVKEN